jgi:diguanylate cyclase (GGDEF)-like protein/PAS domain S-box-containing protein
LNAVTALAPGSSPLRILMVEDDPNDAELIRAYLADAQRAGAEVLHARTLSEGLALMQSHEVHLTLLDLDLPDSHGFHTLERMRAAAVGPVIVISGNGHPSLVDEVLKRRAYDVIPKHELDAATLRRVLRLATLHHDAGQALRTTEGRYRALLESSSEALVLLDATGRVEYCSAAMRPLLGYDAAEAIGRVGVSFVQPEDREAVQAAFRELRAAPGATSTLRVHFRHQDGSVRALQSTLVNRLDDEDVAAVVCSYRDLSREEEQRARFDATFEHAAVGLAHVDPVGRILLANRRLCEMLGYTLEELVGREVRELSHPEDLEVTRPPLERLHAGEIPQFSARKRYLRKSGEALWVQLTVTLERDAAGEAQYAIAAFEDVTQAVRTELAEQRLRRMYAALSAANEAILKIEDTPTLYRRVCELLIDHGGLKLAAVRLVDPQSRWIETVAHAGESAGYLDVARIPASAEVLGVQGPTSQAITDGRTVVSNDYLAEPSLATWHAAARAAGIASMMSVPLRRAGAPVGLLSLYAAEAGWFDDELIALAERMAHNLSFALDNIDREAARRASEERFRALTAMSSDFYWETDAEHRFTLRESGAHSSAASTFAVNDWRGKTRWDLPALSPDEHGWREHRALLDAHLPFRDFEFSRPCEEVGERFISVSGDPVFDAEGRFAGYRGVGTDTSARRAAQQVLDLEHTVALQLSAAEDALEGVHALMQAVCEIYGWEHGRYWEVDETSGLLRFRALWGRPGVPVAAMSEALRDIVFHPGEGLAGCVWQSGEPLWVPDAGQDPRAARHALPGAPLRAAFLFPVVVEGRVIGVFTFASERIRRPDENQLRAAGTVASQIGQFLRRMRGEERLRQSEERFRSLTQLSSDWYWEQDAQLRFTRFSGGQGDEKWGGDQGVAIGLKRWEIPGLAPLSGTWEEHRAVLEARQPFRNFEYLRVAEDGGRRYVASSGEPVFDAHGEFAGYRGTATDITERMSSERRMRLEHLVTQELAEASDAVAGMTAAMRAICESEGWDRGSYFEVDEDAQVLRFGAGWSIADPEAFIEGLRSIVLAKGEGPRGIAWRDGQPLWVADMHTDPRMSPKALAVMGEMRSACVFPVTRQGKAIGVLSISARKALEPDEHLLQTLRTLGSQIGQFLQRKHSEEAQRRFRAGMDASADMILLIDPRKMRYVDVNEAVCRTLGYSREEMLSMGPHDILPMAREELQRMYLKFVAEPSGIHGMDGVYRGKDGSRVPFESTRQLLQTDGGALIVAISRDVRQRLEAERALRDSEERFRSLTELSSDWYWEQDTELRFVATGGHDKNRGGITAEQHSGLRRWELPGTEPLEGGWEAHRALVEARRPFRDFMLKRTGVEGDVHYVSVSGEPIFGADGLFRGYRGVARDVTRSFEAVVALRRSEEHLRASHERFEIVSRATNDVVWDWNLVTDEIWWNENFRTLFGYGPDEIGDHVDSWTSRIHPEDLGRIKAEVDGAIATGAMAWSGEYRFRCKDGTYLDVYDRGLLTYDAHGRAVRMIGAMMDVSERKHAESRMRRHAEHQAAIAGFGQFALDRRSTEELYVAAVRALCCEGVDAVCLMEMFTDSGEFLVRAAQGEGPHATVGLRGAIAPDSVWPEMLRENTSRIAGREYLTSRPLDRPWRAWLHAMGSAVYVPVRDDAKPIAMLCIYAVTEHAFGTEEVRFAETIAHVLSTALQRQKAEQRLAHLAQFDPLTGLPNRALLQERLAQSIVRSRRRKYHAGVLFVDLDRFKMVNDTLGHHQGDALIRQVGERLLACVRPGDTVGRIAGDEFALVLADMARPDDAALVAQKILDAIARPFDLGGNEAYVGASIGIAAFPDDGDDAATLLKNADIAMYRAKEQGRNGYRFFTAEMNQRTLAKAQLNTDLRRAIERAEFTLHYQPKVDLADGRLRGLEALLRWNHPQRGMVPPAEFIPALEDSGLILPVGEWVIAEACAQLRRWQQAGCAPVPVAVNLSPKQFRRRDLDRLIREALEREGMPAELLELEITESSLMEDPEDAVRSMHDLRAAGLKISIDDFGTGYSSLSYLTRLPLSALKIDRSFVRDAGDSEEAASIVRAVINMAQNLRFTVIAEGVETQEQVAFLRKHGCDQAQGYFFGRPVSAEQTAKLLPRA